MEDIVFRFGQDAPGSGHTIGALASAIARAVAEALGREPVSEAATLSLASLGDSHGDRRLLFELPTPERPANSTVPRLEANDRGWIRKVILYTGTWPAGPLGASDEQFAITLQDLENIVYAFDAGAYERVPVPWGHGPLGSDMDHATRFNTGWVRQLQIEADSARAGEYVLVAWIEFVDQEALAKIRQGSVWNVSVMLAWDVQRPSDGKVFPLALKHVALTNFPWVEGMAGFSRGQGVEDEQVEPEHAEEEIMGTEKVVALSDYEKLQVEMARLQEQAKEQAEALAAREAKLAETEQALAARAEKLAEAQRSVRIREVVMALEGGENTIGVVLPEGHRHYPAVVSAVESILRDKDGSEDVLIALLNALPEAALQKVAKQPVARATSAEDEEPGEPVIETPEDVESYMKEMGI